MIMDMVTFNRPLNDTNELGMMNEIGSKSLVIPLHLAQIRYMNIKTQLIGFWLTHYPLKRDAASRVHSATRHCSPLDGIPK